MSYSFPLARRLSGRNDYDDIRIDIPASFADVRQWLSERPQYSVVGNRWRNTLGLTQAIVGNRLPAKQNLFGATIHDPHWFARFQSWSIRDFSGKVAEA